MRRSLVPVLLAILLAWAASARAGKAPARWDIVAAARGQTVYWNAWGGSQRINDYIAWVAGRVAGEHDIALRHVKLADTAEAVSRVLAEKAAGRTSGGSVDLVWINGENFATMREHDLLFGPFAQLLPNSRLVDTSGKATTTIDFALPVEGMESPWGMAQLVFLYDTARLSDPPRSTAALLRWAQAHPGRFTYPAPPDFTGATFLKQALYELAPDPGVLQRPAADADFDAATAPLWAWLDALHPHLWRKGRIFPASDQAQRQLLDDGEIDISLSFNPGEASSAIAQGLLPDTVRTYVLEGGTIGNTHFVAIPFNASAKEGAMVVADFLLSPEAQLRKQDPAIWGDPTVLDLARLAPEDRSRFDALPLGPATLHPQELGRTLPEPHASWVGRIEDAWRRRYAR